MRKITAILFILIAIVLPVKSITIEQQSRFFGHSVSAQQSLVEFFSQQMSVSFQYYATDSFIRVDNPSTLGNLEVGGTWLYDSSTWGILGNNAYMPSGGSSGFAYFQALSDGTLQVKVNTIGSGEVPGLLFRYTDNTHYWRFVQFGTDAYLQNRNGGSVTTIAGPIAGSADGDVLKVILNGDSITCYRNGTSIASTSDSLNDTSAFMGIYSQGGSASRFSGFFFTNTTPPVQPTNYNLVDFYSSDTASGFVKLDYGSPVRPTAMRFTPRQGDGVTDYETTLTNAVLESSDDNSSWTSVQSINSEPQYYPRFQLNEIPITSSAHRYWRLRTASTQLQLSEIELLGYSGGTYYRPITPTISPWGGRFTNGAPTITLASMTAGASIYYTTNGSTPDNTSLLYSGPFTLNLMGVGNTVEAVAYDSGTSTYSHVSTAYFRPWMFRPQDDWYDNRGILIEAHDPDIIDQTGVDGYYYMIGAFANMAQSSIDSRDVNRDHGIWMYRSTDMVNWQFVSQILPSPYPAPSVVRLHVLWNALTSKWVGWAHAYSISGEIGACIATSSALTNGWSWANTNYSFPDSTVSADLNLIKDPNNGGTNGYLINNVTVVGDLVIWKLGPQYTNVVGSSTTIAAFAAGHGKREAPAPFIITNPGVSTNWFVINSIGNYYDSTSTFDQRYSVNTTGNPLGTWGANNALFTTDPLSFGSPTNNLFNGQSSCVFTKDGVTVCTFDHWHSVASDGRPLYDSRQVWLPLMISGTSLSITNFNTNGWQFAAP